MPNIYGFLRKAELYNGFSVLMAKLFGRENKNSNIFMEAQNTPCSFLNLRSLYLVSPPSMFTRILKMLSNKELLDSQQGPQGGYSLTKSAENISVREVIEAMEGPIALTECSDDDCGCAYETSCAVGKPWQKINKAIIDVLQNINLAEMGMKDESQQLLKLTNITEMIS